MAKDAHQKHRRTHSHRTTMLGDSGRHSLCIPRGPPPRPKGITDFLLTCQDRPLPYLPLLRWQQSLSCSGAFCSLWSPKKLRDHMASGVRTPTRNDTGHFCSQPVVLSRSRSPVQPQGGRKCTTVMCSGERGTESIWQRVESLCHDLEANSYSKPRNVHPLFWLWDINQHTWDVACAWILVIHETGWDGALGCWLWPGLALATAAIWGVSQ